jgi:2-pyrone-4,6-dicarboxylate lactonase
MATPPLTPPPNRTPRKPTLVLPAGSIDSHVHLFGPVAKYPFAPNANYVSEDATDEMYFALQQQLGLSRVVLVSGGGYGESYTHLTDTLKKWPDRMRGVVRLRSEFTDHELEQLNAVGVRGARYFGGAHRIPLTPEIASRIRNMGWHVQFFPGQDQLPDIAPFLLGLNVLIVFDHFAHVSAAGGANSRAFRTLCEMIDTGRVWVKISGPMRITEEEPPYPSVTPLATALVRHAPERLLWGSD